MSVLKIRLEDGEADGGHDRGEDPGQRPRRRQEAQLLGRRHRRCECPQEVPERGNALSEVIRPLCLRCL